MLSVRLYLRPVTAPNAPAGGPPPGGGPPPPGPPGPPPPRAPSAPRRRSRLPLRRPGLALASKRPRPRQAQTQVHGGRTARVIPPDGGRARRRIQVEASESRGVDQTAPVQPEALRPAISSGRSAANPSPFESIPVVMLYGVPLCTRKNGLMVNFSNSGRLLPSSKRCRISANEEGPHSALRLDGLAGAPSLSSIP